MKDQTADVRARIQEIRQRLADHREAERNDERTFMHASWYDIETLLAALSHGDAPQENADMSLGNTASDGLSCPPSTPGVGECAWHLNPEDCGLYVTACGAEFAPDDGSADGMAFCFNCGRRLVVVLDVKAAGSSSEAMPDGCHKSLLGDHPPAETARGSVCRHCNYAMAPPKVLLTHAVCTKCGNVEVDDRRTQTLAPDDDLSKLAVDIDAAIQRDTGGGGRYAAIYGTLAGHVVSRMCGRILHSPTPEAGNQQWTCGASKSIDPPQDCGWPTCGCDPYAQKVIDALAEAGTPHRQDTE